MKKIIFLMAVIMGVAGLVQAGPSVLDFEGFGIGTSPSYPSITIDSGTVENNQSVSPLGWPSNSSQFLASDNSGVISINPDNPVKSIGFDFYALETGNFSDFTFKAWVEGGSNPVLQFDYDLDTQGWQLNLYSNVAGSSIAVNGTNVTLSATNSGPMFDRFIFSDHGLYSVAVDNVALEYNEDIMPVVPAPTSILLGSLGVVAVGFLRYYKGFLYSR